MPSLTEKEICNGIEGNLCNNQKYEEKDPKMIDVKKTNINFEQRLQKILMKYLFCSLCN